jgi:hypothetical protein
MKRPIWDDKLHSLTASNCGDFMNRIFTIADEAFILIVLVNYQDLWRAEVERARSKGKLDNQKKRKWVCKATHNTKQKNTNYTNNTAE